MDKIKILLTIGSVVLLLVIIFLITNFKPNTKDQGIFPINVFKKSNNQTQPKSIISHSLNPRTFSYPSLKPSKRKTESNYIYPFPQPLNKKTSKKFSNLLKRLPVETESFQASFAASLGKIVVLEKTYNAKKDFRNFFLQNGLTEKSIEKFIVKTSNPEQAKEIFKREEIIKNVHIQELIKPKPTPTPYKFKTITEYKKEQELKTSKSLENTIRKIFSILSTPAEYFVPKEEPPSSSTPPLTQKPIPPSLKGIILEVSQRVGVPEGVLMGVLSIENPAVFYLPEIKVREYSKSGAIWPECRPNVCSAAGPMQITTGVDFSGSSACSQCCWKGKCLDTSGGCPNQWAIYGQAVNLYGGYNRQPNPCNILDNIYAGALKLKTDSRTSNPLLWTKEEVFRAARAYYGDCSVKYQRLGNRTYCEYVWDYYQNYLK